MIRTDNRDAAEQGLRDYVHRVADAVHVGPKATCTALDLDVVTGRVVTATAYIALDQRFGDFPERDVALVWDQDHGWAVCLETGSAEDLIVVAYLGGALLPGPSVVSAFVRDALTRTCGRSAPTNPPNLAASNVLRLLAALR